MRSSPLIRVPYSSRVDPPSQPPGDGSAQTRSLAVLATLVRRTTMVATCAWKNKLSNKTGVPSITPRPEASIG